jgi:hypothetical protein
MKTFLTIIFCLIATTVFGSPFLVCDTPPAGEGITHYKLTGWSIPQTPAPLHMDVATAAVGTTNLTIAACRADAVWGEQCSVTVPFALTRPAPPSVPSGQRLVAE